MNDPSMFVAGCGSQSCRRTCVLRVRDLQKKFGGRTVLDGINLELFQGDVALLEGENGSGKTTLLNVLTGNMEPDAGSIWYATDNTMRMFRFPRPWWRRMVALDGFNPDSIARRGVGRTWQNLRLFGEQSLHTNIAVGAVNQPGENPVIALLAPGISNRRETEINSQVDGILDRLGLATRGRSSADKVSLGQCKRVAIARAVVAGARVLLLDEPLAGLDADGISDTVLLLGALLKQGNLSLVIVEHIINHIYLHSLVNKIWRLKSGRIRGLSDDLGKLPRKQNVVDSRITLPEWFSRLGDPASITRHSLPRGAVLARIRGYQLQSAPRKPVLEIRGLAVRRSGRSIFGTDDSVNSASKLDLVLYEGEVGLIQAPNGWGKSTLLACLCGLIAIEEGSIFLNGERLDHLPPWERVRKGLRALPSEGKLFSSLSVEETLLLAGASPPHRAFEQLSHRVCSSLSGGERQRVALASLSSACIMIYDEPFTALDADARSELLAILKAEHGIARLLLTPSFPVDCSEVKNLL